jgi:hypothetical protein
MNYKDIGEIQIADADDANIPVNSFLTAPDADSDKWRWTADNFMPRKGIATEGRYSIEADSKEAVLEVVQKYVVPLYEAALHNLKTEGACYYWERKQPPATP